MTGLRLILGGMIAVGVAVLLAAPASAGERMIRIDAQGPGPTTFDGVDVHQFGPKRPDRVLVLMAGTAGGAGNFTLVARDLVERVKGLAVWSIDRRSQPLEDTSRFESALAGEIDLQQMFDYYLGWLTNGGMPADHFEFLDTSTVPFAKRWGMKNALKDARKVVKRARRVVGKRSRREGGDKKVFLGGHSLGASLAAAYAAWDFDGRPGYKSVDGVVLIDGGLLGSFATLTRDQAVEQVASLEDEPFLDLLGVGIPDAAGLFAESGAIMARLDPTGDGKILREFPLLPAEFKPPVDATNRGNLGYAFDRDTSPPGLALLHVNAGSLAPAGDPRDWVDGGLTPVENVAATFGAEPANGVEWYFPRRLTIDTDGANEMKRNAVARYLGLRLMHTRQIDVPIYAFQTDLTDGRVLAGAEKLVRRAKTKRRDSVLVDGDPRYSHLDPLMAASGKNLFTRTVTGFIRSYSDR
jgi:pimeloyl-ACP methyl ester carboxylesterase